MTTYDFEGGSTGTATSANTGASGVSIGTGNTMTVATDQEYSGSRSLKIVMGTSAVSVLDYRATGNPSLGSGTPFGTPSDLTSGMRVMFWPTGGIDSSGTGASAVTIINQWYGGTSSTEGSASGRYVVIDPGSGLTSSGSTITQTNTPLGTGDKIVFTAVGAATNITVGTTYWVVGKTASTFQVAATRGGTALALGTATGIAYAQSLRFNNNAVTALYGIYGNMSLLAGHWVILRHQISHGASATGGYAAFRIYDGGTAATPLFPGVDDYLAETVTPTVTGSGGSATGGIDLGGASGTYNLVTRFRLGFSTGQGTASTSWWDWIDETPGSLQWVAGPAVAVTGSGTSAVTASASGDGAVGAVGSGTATAAVSLTGSGVVATSVGGDLTTTATTTGAGVTGKASGGALGATATTTGAGAIAATGSGTLAATVTITGAGAVIAAGVGAGTLAETITATGVGVVGTSSAGAQPETVTTLGAGSVGTSTTGTRPETVTITGAGTVTIPAGGTYVAVVAITGSGTVTAGSSGTGTRPETVTITGAGATGASKAGTAQAAVTIVGAGQVATTSSGQAPTVVALAGAGVVAVTAAGGRVSTVVIDGTGAVTTSAAGTLAVTAVITGGGTVVTTPVRDVTVTILGPYLGPDIHITGPYNDGVPIVGPYAYPLTILGPTE